MSRVRRWLIMACLCLSGGLIYLLPFLREVYYIPLQEALHLSNTELGFLMSTFGATAMICYFPGGWLADRVSPRKLIAFSMVATGVIGLYFATFPSYILSIAVHAFWGVSCTLTFWAAMIKATRSWALPDQQGRTLAVDVVESIGPEGQFLDTDHTLDYYRERWYPSLFDRNSHDSWVQNGGKSLAERAAERIDRLLVEHKPAPLPDSVKKDLQSIVEKAKNGLR